MPEGIQQYLDARSATQLARDALDVLIVYYVTYRVLLLVKGTRAQHVGVGLLFVFALYVVAQLLHLVTMLSILSSLISSIILVVVVVFQSDIRRGLIRMGSRAWFPGQAHAQESRVIDEVVQAATELARHRMGAIITFEQDANLDEFVGVHKGKELDAVVSSELLVSLFIPEGMNKLHDGSVIIRNLRVAKAGVFFPMPEGKVLDQHFGSRHRAAVGITEETDAVVVVVSEERGTISCCFNGNIAPDLNGARLREMLGSIFNPRPRRKKAGSASPQRPSVVPASDVKEVRSESRPEGAAEEISTTLLDAGAPSQIRGPSESKLDGKPPLRPRQTDHDTGPLSTRVSTTSDPPPPLRPRHATDPDAPIRGDGPQNPRGPRGARLVTPMPRTEGSSTPADDETTPSSKRGSN